MWIKRLISLGRLLGTSINVLLLKRHEEPIVQDVLLGFPRAVPANKNPIMTTALRGKTTNKVTLNAGSLMKTIQT